MEDFARFVPNVHFEQIPIKNLVSSQKYQRILSPSHIERAAENFDLYQINPVKVSRRDGINYVFNGQHTIEIVARVSGSRETPVWCMIYDDLSYTHEADIFANQQKFVKPLLAYEVFQGNLEAGNQEQLMIRDLVESYGLKLGNAKAPGVICCISTVEAIYQKYGYHVLNRVLRLDLATWEGDINSFSANMLNAIAKMITVYKDALSDEIFKEKLGEISIKALTRMGKERRPGSVGIAEAMVIVYNGKKKNPACRLPMNRLHAKENTIFSDVSDQEDYDPDEGMEDDDQACLEDPLDEEL